MSVICPDASEILHYDIPDFPLMFRNNHIDSCYDFRDISVHWHDAVELTYVYSGSVCHQVNGETVCLREGEGVFINSRQMHLIQTDHKDCSLYCLIFHPTLLCASGYITRQYVASVIENENIPYIIMKKDVDWHREIFEAMADIDGKIQTDLGPLQVMQNVFRIWQLLYENMEVASYRMIKNQNLSLVKQMILYIQNHYSEKLTLQRICQEGGLGKTKSIQLFDQYVHMTPMDYVNHYRIEQATCLLRETDATITEIAEKTGFSESSYFAKMFRKQMGQSPKEYRNFFLKGE